MLPHVAQTQASNKVHPFTLLHRGFFEAYLLDKQLKLNTLRRLATQ